MQTTSELGGEAADSSGLSNITLLVVSTREISKLIPL